MREWSEILCVDWAKDHPKRRAWVADIAGRSIAPLSGINTSFAELLSYACGRPGRTLIGIDAVLGVPLGCFELGRAFVGALPAVRDFPSWLLQVSENSRFWQEVTTPIDWNPNRPFISLPRGSKLTPFVERARGSLKRDVDIRTTANSPFVVSGIPGTVGAGTRQLWQEIAPCLRNEREFGLWPFDGVLDSLDWRDVVIGEIYPKVCYGLALAPQLPATLQSIKKTSCHARAVAVDALSRATWISSRRIAIRNLDRAVADEDDFDAMISAAGLLRCVLEHAPLESERTCVIEGGMLGLGSIAPPNGDCRLSSQYRKPDVDDGDRRRAAIRHNVEYYCPITGCTKIFVGSRSGWDAHVGSARAHPTWHADVHDPHSRKTLFRAQFGDWFE